ncbi:MAG: hypothetical protein JXL84_03930 [Deltaproteobacteria bacterium]|nr:hypothetical protein [Deltaproteobacteria bacterium]
MKGRSMSSREFWDARQLSLFDYIQHKKGETLRRDSFHTLRRWPICGLTYFLPVALQSARYGSTDDLFVAYGSFRRGSD